MHHPFSSSVLDMTQQQQQLVYMLDCFFAASLLHIRWQEADFMK
jgi:hypothetical protein